MTLPRRSPALVILGLLAAVASTARASAPVGVWGLVEEVTLEPNDDSPSVMRIDGLFAVAGQQPDFPQLPGYSQPQYGYIYYVCLAKQLPTCAMEWKELLAVAGTADNCRGWGDDSFEVHGTVHPAGEPMRGQDVYPVSMGVVTGIAPCQALTAWQMQNPDPDTDGSTGSPGTTGDGSTGAPGTTGSPGTTGIGDPATSSGDTPTSGGSPTEVGSTTAVTAGETTGDAEQLGDRGCACDGGSPGQSSPGALALLIGLGLSRRRAA